MKRVQPRATMLTRRSGAGARLAAGGVIGGIFGLDLASDVLLVEVVVLGVEVLHLVGERERSGEGNVRLLLGLDPGAG